MCVTKLQFSYFILIVSLVILIILSLSVGTIYIPLNKVISILHHPESTIESIMVHTIRMPRTSCAVIVGAALALTGVILFYLSRNELACPSLLGINQGVFLGVILSVVLTHEIMTGHMLISGVIAGVCIGLLSFFIAFKLGFSPLQLILIGQTINLFCYAACQLLLISAPDRADLLLVHLNGSLANSNWALLQSCGLILAGAILLTFFFIKKNYLLSLGRDVAKSIGLNVSFYLCLFLGIILILCTCSVVIVGPLLFFPLLVLQCSKLIISSNRPYHFALINVLMGSILLLTSDLLIRTLYPGWEAPLNVFIAMLGVPFLILHARRTG